MSAEFETSPHLSLPQWLGSYAGAPFEDEFPAAHAWGLFEIMDEGGRFGWIERSSLGYDAQAICAQLSGFLGDVERWPSATDNDPEPEEPEVLGDPASLADEALPGDEGSFRLSSDYDGLTFIQMRPGDRLTDRWVLLIMGTVPPDEHEAPAQIRIRGLSGPELEGYLRLAVARFTESLSWSAPGEREDEDSAEDEDDAPRARDTAFGELVPGWNFPAHAQWAPAELWAAIEIESTRGERCWVERSTAWRDPRLLAATLLRQARLVEDALINDWDEPEDRPPRARVPEAPAADEPDPATPVGPLDARLAALRVPALPPGWRARRLMLLSIPDPALDPLSVHRLYAANPDAWVAYPFVSDAEELGLLRGALRYTIR